MKGLRFNYKNTAGVAENDIKKIAERAEQYRLKLAEIADKQDWSAEEASILLPDQNREALDAALKIYQNKQLRFVIVIGIGGSILGTQAIYNALRKTDYINGADAPQMLFLDALDERRLADILSLLDKKINGAEEIVINVVSKSGRTVETLANFEILASELSKRFGDILSRVVATTDENSPLWKIAKGKNIRTLPIPKMVGGKFSVLSPVGLFPLELCGISARELLEGARAARAFCLAEAIEDNPALTRAAVIFTLAEKGKNILNNFFFNPEMRSVGQWYRQLIGEGLGNRLNRDGAVVRNGITPLVSLGSTDLHSMLQLYLGGPTDKITTFIFSPATEYNLRIPENKIFGTIKNIGRASALKLTRAMYEGVTASYLKEKLPFLEIQLSVISAQTLGALLQTFMLEIMYLAHLQNVNAFDQPSVELYKQEMRDKLSKNKNDGRPTSVI